MKRIIIYTLAIIAAVSIGGFLAGVDRVNAGEVPRFCPEARQKV